MLNRLNYRIGFIGWKFAAKLGFRLTAVIRVIYDKEANVFVATSPSIKNLIVEAKTWDELVREVHYVADDLLSFELSANTVTHNEYRIHDCAMA
jgi:hypothetical protein